MNALRPIGLALLCCLGGCASTAPSTSRIAVPTATRCTLQSSAPPSSARSVCIGPGNSYSRADIAHTGRTTLAGALADLDPALTIQR